MKKVLLIGVDGCVGDRFREYMKRYPNYEILEVPSTNREWGKISFKGSDAVYNVFGLAHANACQGTEEQHYAISRQLLIDIAIKTGKEGVPIFIQISSVTVYGNMSPFGKQRTIAKEAIPTSPTIYGKSKMIAENDLYNLEDIKFQVAIIHPPSIYSEDARDNFPKLTFFVRTTPLFSDLENQQSVLYVDNLYELAHLIIDNSQGGTCYPQQKAHIETSRIVGGTAEAVGSHTRQTRILNPFLCLFSKSIVIIQRTFGGITYDMNISNHFEGKYHVVSYEESIARIVDTYMRV